MVTWYRPIDLARAAGVTPQTVRRYEAAGLLPPAVRTSSRHRRYGERHLRALQAARVMQLGYGGPMPQRMLQAVHWGNPAAAVAAIDACHAALHDRRRAVEDVLFELRAVVGRTGRGAAAPAVGRFPLRVGEAAGRVGVRVSTVRFWEDRGMLKPGRDPESRYRTYDEQQFRRLQTVALLRGVGYDFTTIQAVLAELEAGDPDRTLSAAERRLAVLARASCRCAAATAAFWSYLEASGFAAFLRDDAALGHGVNPASPEQSTGAPMRREPVGGVVSADSAARVGCSAARRTARRRRKLERRLGRGPDARAEVSSERSPFVAEEATTRRSTSIAYNEPFAWWGPAWATPHPRSILDLIADGTLGRDAAALLWALLARRASILVAAGPSGAGKTTLLTALLDFLPPGTRRLYLRGCYEPFAFLDDPAVAPTRSYLLVNEISGHLPVYLWGPAVRRLLQATRAGFALAATAHARTLPELVGSLCGYPLRVPAGELAAFQIVVILDAGQAGGTVRRSVATIAALTATGAGEGVGVAEIGGRRGRDARLTLDLAAAGPLFARLGGDPAGLPQELRERAAALAGLGTESSEEPGGLPDRLASLGQRWVPPAVIG